MNSWTEQLLPIIMEFSNGGDEPLDGDDVDRLCSIIKLKINLHQGNITQGEYDRRFEMPTHSALPCGTKYSFNHYDLIGSLNAYAVRRKIDWNILDTIRLSKGGKLIIDIELLDDIDPYGDKESFAVNVLQEFKDVVLNKANA